MPLIVIPACLALVPAQICSIKGGTSRFGVHHDAMFKMRNEMPMTLRRLKLAFTCSGLRLRQAWVDP